MNAACRRFQDALAQSLSGPAAGDAELLRTLSWHEHLLGCEVCRALLEEEEALDGLLATLPTPQLDPGLARRVLARLSDARESEALDDLLARDRVDPAPADLAGRVLAGLGSARAEAELDALLDHLPRPEVAVGLPGRVLARLESERGATGLESAREPAGRTLSMRRFLSLAAAAALVLGAFLGWRGLRGDPSAETSEALASVGEAEAPPADLLESLEVLESWDLLTDDSIDATLSSLDAVDVLLFELAEGHDPLSNG